MNHLANKTRVLVTHKFESLKYVDYIYVFHKGKIVEQGTAEALNDSPIFQEISKKCQLITKEEEESAAADEIPQDLTKTNREEESSGILEKEEVLQQEEKIKDIPDDKILQEKLMLDEDRETGSVGWSVWKAYFNYYGGYLYFIIVFFGKIFSSYPSKILFFSYDCLDLCSNRIELLVILLE